MPKKIFIWCGIAGIAIIVTLLFLSRGHAPSKVAVIAKETIYMSKGGFSPSEISIRSGDAVQFVNSASSTCPQSDASCFFWPASDLHPTHELYPEFDPREPISPGESWTFTFIRTGNWRFHDHLHPNQRGMVKVSE